MFLRRLKHKAKLLSSSGSPQHIEDECEVESQGSLDSGIRQGNLRCLTTSYATASNSVVEAEVQGTLKTGQALGFGMLRTCRCWEHPLEARWTESWKIGMTTNNAILQLDTGYVLPSFLMKILFWNSCGLGMSAKGVSIRNTVLHNDIEVCFLLGTKRAMCCDNFVHAL